MARSVAEWLSGGVDFEIDGRRWPIVFTYRVLLACERLTGIEMLSANMSKPSARLIRALLFLALETAGAPCTLEEVGARLTPKTLPEAGSVIARAWIASMPEPKPVGEEGPTGTSKPLTWPDAWAEATSRHGLGLTDEQWLAMTPLQVGSLEALRLRQMQREELLVGMMIANSINYSYCRPKKPMSPNEFMLHKFDPAPLEPITGEYIMEQMRRKNYA